LSDLQCVAYGSDRGVAVGFGGTISTARVITSWCGGQIVSRGRGRESAPGIKGPPPARKGAATCQAGPSWPVRCGKSQVGRCEARGLVGTAPLTSATARSFRDPEVAL